MRGAGRGAREVLTRKQSVWMCYDVSDLPSKCSEGEGRAQIEQDAELDERPVQFDTRPLRMEWTNEEVSVSG